MNKFDLYQDITNRIIEAIENGTIPWRKPWNINNGVCALPINAVSKRPYSGVNILLLWAAEIKNGYSQSQWLSFKNIAELGGTIKKGEKATKILFWRTWEKDKTDDTGAVVLDDQGQPEKESGCTVKYFNVFNVEQCENLPQKFYENSAMQIDENLAYDAIHRISKGMNVPVLAGKSDKAFYSPGRDCIIMPAMQAFDSIDHFNAVLLHELTHSTGAKHRLNRNQKGNFGSADYAFEELVAELGSAFTSASLGVKSFLENNASYIDNWLTILKQDKKAIVQASKLAREASNYMLEFDLLEGAAEIYEQCA
ncbi:ArdC family protein [Actinobacillus delphinicola]|uniref:DNA primase TraC n=1 Tax=Actinobacillus delphinicola TaxID=51161 RepID=A0A448TTV9_9PAST|nr:zincin-like metallopeptidase domain-containing protein [Actinobacillus delphinicola]VEJ09376.1 DNA primase TraC [Actinobacillus delphinicola]